MPASLFHLAFHVGDLDQARQFYCSLLGCQEGRSTDTWVDIDFFGHQLSLHLGTPWATTNTGHVGEHLVPMPHFGAVLPLSEFESLAGRLKAGGIEFIIEPTIRFAGEPGEQHTMFFRDPFGNPMEFKAFTHDKGVFAR